MTTEAKPKGGLEDVVATSSAICYLDGDRGVLAYCGYDIHDLAQKATFEEVCFLLWHRRLPTRAELGDLHSALAAGRPLPEAVLRLLRTLPPSNGMDILRTVSSALAHSDPDADDHSPAANYRKAVRLTAQMASLVATYGRLNAGGAPIQPDPALGHAANFLYMLTGDRPNATAVRAFDIALTLHADHELNASTFAARVTAATLSDIHSAIVAGIGALKGPLHGGAPGPALDLVFAVRASAAASGRPLAAEAEAAVRAVLAGGGRLMGFGHRVYRVRDPRADVLGAAAPALFAGGGDGRLFDDARVVEQVILRVLRAHKPDRRLDTNVEFYTALLLHGIGLPAALFTPTFALARAGGWTAHVLEQMADNRLIRPSAAYVGPRDGHWPRAAA